MGLVYVDLGVTALDPCEVGYELLIVVTVYHAVN
jgi:hypothetical protein